MSLEATSEISARQQKKAQMTIPTVKPDFHPVNPSPEIEPEGEPWRSMSADDALDYLAAQDAARRTEEARDKAYGLRLGGYANRRQLVAWRCENGLCAKCGRAIPADEAEFKHCPRCRQSFCEQQRRVNANLTEPQRLARNERARRSYHKLTHGKAPPPKATWRALARLSTPTLPPVTPTGTPVTPTTVMRVAPAGPKRDRAEYMRAYRANRN